MNRRKYIMILFAIIFMFATAIFFAAEYYSSKYTENVLRFHVLANSDSIEDQALKLKVRNCVGEKITELSKNSKSAEETENIVINNIECIKKEAENCIKNEGYTYGVEIQTGEFYFPTKHYGNKSLPAGNYEAVRVLIGEGKGKNWWCVLFPPLCFSNGNSMENGLADEVADDELIIRFKFVELYQKAKHKIVNFFSSI